MSGQEAVASARQIRLHLGAPQRAVEVRTNTALATEMLVNIVDNAIRYNRPGGQVSVIVDERPAAIRVEDDGPGIPPEDREKVFERFIRLNPHAGNDGSGLGLSIAHSIAETLGLDLGLDGGPGDRGLRLTIIFPPDADSLVKGP